MKASEAKERSEAAALHGNAANMAMARAQIDKEVAAGGKFTSFGRGQLSAATREALKADGYEVTDHDDNPFSDGDMREAIERGRHEAEGKVRHWVNVRWRR